MKPVDVPALTAEGPTTNLLDDAATDHSLALFEGNPSTADASATSRDLNLGSPLISPSTSHLALASSAAAAAGLESRHDMSSAEDLLPDSSSSNCKTEGPAASLTARSAVNSAPQQQQQYREGSPFLQQHHQSNVTAELLGMQLQMQQYLVQHPEAEQSYQQQRASYEEQRRSKLHEQQQQQIQGSKRLAPAGALASAAASYGSSAGGAPLPGLFSRNVAGWDSDRSAAAAGGTDADSSALAGVEPGSSNGHADGPDLNVAAAAPAAGGPFMVPQQQQQQNGRQSIDVNSSRDQMLKQTAGMPPRSPSVSKMLSDTGSGGISRGPALPAGWYAHNSSSTPAVLNYALSDSNFQGLEGDGQGSGEAKGMNQFKLGLKPLSQLQGSAQSDDSSPFRQQRFGDDQAYSVVPMTAGMPPLSPIRIPSNNSHNNLLKLISHSGALDPDLSDSPQSPRMSVVGVSNSVIDNFLSEEGIPLVPTEPALGESVMDPVPETLEFTPEPETPKRVRSFVSLKSLGGSSSTRHQWGSVPSTPRRSSGTSGVLPAGISGDAAPLAGTWSGTGGDQDGTQDGASPLRAGQVVRGYRGQRQLVTGTRGGIVSESNVNKCHTSCSTGSAYRRRSNAAAGSFGDDVSSWDESRVSGLRSGSSTSRKLPVPPAAAAAGRSRARRGSSSYYEIATPRANRVSLSFNEMQRPPLGSSSGNMFNRASLGSSSNHMFHRASLGSNSSNMFNRASFGAPSAAAAARGGEDFILLDADSVSGSVTQPLAVANADADVAVEDLPGSDLDMFAADADDLGMSAAHIAAAASFSMSPPDNPNPSHMNNIVDWFEPTTTSMTPRGSQSRRYSIEPQDFGSESFNGGGSSSSSRYFEADRGFKSNAAASNTAGSQALARHNVTANAAQN